MLSKKTTIPTDQVYSKANVVKWAKGIDLSKGRREFHPYLHKEFVFDFQDKDQAPKLQTIRPADFDKQEPRGRQDTN